MRQPRPGNTGPSNTGSSNPGQTKMAPAKGEMPKAGTTNTATSQGTYGVQSAAGRSHILRERLYWETPRIYADPQKPTMPIHAPPLEHVVRTGRRMPGVVTGMRTPSEVARLQKQVHSLRHELLDRTWQCPYAECTAGPFKVNDPGAIDWHMRVQHSTLKCFLCNDTNYLFPYYDHKTIRDHLVSYHAAEVKELFGIPGADMASDTEGSAGNGGMARTHAASAVHIDDTEARVAEILERLRQVEESRATTSTSTPTSTGKGKWRPLRDGESTPPQRDSSPDWDSDDSDYEPPADARCSRCFRAAGFDKTWIRVSLQPPPPPPPGGGI